MDRPAEVEFLSGDPGPAPEEELRPVRRLPRWAGLAGVAAVAGLIVVAVVTRPGAGHPAAVPTSLVAPVPTPTWAPPAPVSAVADVVLSGSTTWELYSDHLTTGARTAPLAEVLSSAGAARLLLDLPHGRVWVVVEGNGPGQVLELDATTLTELHTFDLGTIAGAGVLAGQLYLAVGPHLIRIDGTGKIATLVTSPTTAFAGLAADSAHGRLLLVDAGGTTRLWSYRPGGRLAAVRASLSIADASLTVVAGQVWVEGYESSGEGPVAVHVIERVGRVGLRTAQLGPDAVIVGVGERVVWLSGAPDSSTLWCVDAATGQALQRWTSADGPVASTTGRAVVATPAGVRPLMLQGCPG